MRVLGLLSGTSHDGIDVAVVDFEEQGGMLRGTVLLSDSVPYSPALRSRLVAALPPAPTTLAEVCELDTLIGQEFADVARDAAASLGGVDAVCTHGQTVYHWVEGDRARGTLQIGQPAWIAEAVGVPVVSDVRIRDITVGGHGAPLVSYLDELLLGGRAGVSGALNLGGIANLTIVGQQVSAYDVGPANALIDGVIAAYGLNPLGFDEDARVALAGSVDDDLLTALLDDPYYALTAPKTTGKEHFHLGYVHEHVERLGRDIPVADLVRTLAELTVRTVARDVRAAGIQFLAVSGGGCRNPLIMDGIRAALPDTEIVLADELGVSADAKEAVLFALIGWCTMHGVPAVVPGGTGAREPRILGTITPGSGPLRMPEPVAELRSLVLTSR
jgi:anhydro-N-acetylmuramic acid kinase